MHTPDVCLVAVCRAAKRAEGYWISKSFHSWSVQKIFQQTLFMVGVVNQLMVLVSCVYMCQSVHNVFVYTNWKCYWYSTKRSLIESRQCNGREKEIPWSCSPERYNLKASWDPFSRKKFGGPGEVSPFPPSSWWAWLRGCMENILLGQYFISRSLFLQAWGRNIIATCETTSSLSCKSEATSDEQF